MSADINIFTSHKGQTLEATVRKVWDYQSYADEDTVYNLTLSTGEGTGVTFFCTMGQLETLGDTIDKFISSAVDIPQPTINDLVRSQAESEQGFSLA